MPGSSTALWKVGYLARRAGFGLPPSALRALAAGGLPAAVSAFVDYDGIPDASAVPPPQFTGNPNDGRDDVTLQTWWLDRMIKSPRQLEEKMTLFWHNFFATSDEKVGSPPLMYRQNELLRQHAVGDFEQLLSAICIDGAMLVWLDGNGSTKGAPNENFGRESMELFSIGLGQYTQEDVHEAARAYTGWYLDDRNQVQYSPDDHDDDPKTFLGQTGSFSYADIAHILANHPACGRFLARKLWTFFAHENPPDSVVGELAGVYQASNRSIREVVRHLFSMPAFYAPATSTGRVKCPIEHAIIAVREMEAGVKPEDVLNFLWVMDQAPFFPPNVGGWPSGTRWLNTATAVARFGFAEWLLERQQNPADNRVDLASLLARYAAPSWKGVLQQLAQYHLSGPLTPITARALTSYLTGKKMHGPQVLDTFEALLHLVMVSPDYYCA